MLKKLNSLLSDLVAVVAGVAGGLGFVGCVAGDSQAKPGSPVGRRCGLSIGSELLGLATREEIYKLATGLYFSDRGRVDVVTSPPGSTLIGRER